MCDTDAGALAIAAEDPATDGGGKAGDQDVRDFGKFLRMLEVHFEGRRCSLGLYKPLRKASSSGQCSRLGPREHTRSAIIAS